MAEEISNSQFLTIDEGLPVDQTGWEVRIVSDHDWSTIVGYVTDWTNLSGSKSLNEVGSGSITLLSDNPILSTPFPAGLPGDLRTKELLWQFWRDGVLRHEWISDDDSEDEVAEADDETITFSGRTLEKVLEWGIHRPMWGELQSYSITGEPTGGTYRLVVRGQTTAPIAWNASASAVQSAIAALSSVGAGNVLVTREETWTYHVQFQGRFTGIDIPSIRGKDIQLTKPGSGTPGINFPDKDADNTWTDLHGTIIGKPAIASIIAHLDRCKSRGTLPFLDLTFDASRDSAGVPWADITDVTIQPGETLLSLLQRLSAMHGWEFRVDHGFKLWVAQDGYGVHREDKVVFFRGGQQTSHKRQSSSREVATDIYTQSATYEVAHSAADSPVTSHKRERWLEAGGSPSVAAASIVGSATVDLVKDKKVSRTIGLVPEEETRRLFTDFSVADWVGLETRTGVETVKVVGVSWTADPSNDLDLEIVVESAFEARAVRIQRTLDKMGAAAQTGGQGSSPAAPMPLSRAVAMRDLSDVDTSGVEENQVLSWDEVEGVWRPIDFPSDVIRFYEDLFDVDMSGLLPNQIPVWDGSEWKPGDNSGTPGVGISKVERTEGDGSPGSRDTYTITMTDSSTYKFYVYNGTDGVDGSDGSGIEAIIPFDVTHEPGGLDTYLIIFEDSSKNTTFQVYNGLDGDPGFEVLADLHDVDLPEVPDEGYVLTFDTSTATWVARPIPEPEVPSLTDLPDVNASGAGNGQVLAWDAATAKWVPQTMSIPTSLQALSDVLIPTPLNNQVLTWSEPLARWVARTPTGGGGGGGSSTYAGLTDVNVVGVRDGQVMVWDDSTSVWIPADQGGAGVPDGGQYREVLAKLSSADGDADWQNLYELLYMSDLSQFRGEWQPGGVGGEQLLYGWDFQDGPGLWDFRYSSGLESGFEARWETMSTAAGTEKPPYEYVYGIRKTGPGGIGTDATHAEIYLDLGLVPGLTGKAVTKAKFWLGFQNHFTVVAPTISTNVLLDELTVFSSSEVGSFPWREIEISSGIDKSKEIILRAINLGTNLSTTTQARLHITGIEIYGVPEDLVYMMNDTVVHNGRLWRSTVDYNKSEPGVSGTWLEIPLAITPMPPMPTGGLRNEILSKDSNEDGDVTWKPIFELLGVTDMTTYKGPWSAGGIGGEQMLYSQDFEDGIGEWVVDPSTWAQVEVVAIPSSIPGDPGFRSMLQFLKTDSGSNQPPATATLDLSLLPATQGKIVSRVKLLVGGVSNVTAANNILRLVYKGIAELWRVTNVREDPWAVHDVSVSGAVGSLVLEASSNAGATIRFDWGVTGLEIYGTDPANTYKINDLVDHNDKLWRSLYDNNFEEPGTGPRWEEVQAGLKPMPALPRGGRMNEILSKDSVEDGDATWKNIYELLDLTDLSDYRGPWTPGGVGGESQVYSWDFSQGIGAWEILPPDFPSVVSVLSIEDTSITGRPDYVAALNISRTGRADLGQSSEVRLDLSTLPELEGKTFTKVSLYMAVAGVPHRGQVLLDDRVVDGPAATTNGFWDKMSIPGTLPETLTVRLYMSGSSSSVMRGVFFTGVEIYAVDEGSEYLLNDIVSHHDRLWRSTVNYNLAEPGSSPQWEEVPVNVQPSSLPPGGLAGQVLAKASSEDRDVTWVNQTGGGGEGGTVRYGGSMAAAMGTVSGSAYATKGHRFVLYKPLSLVGVSAAIDTVAGASYRAALLETGPDGTVTRVVDRSEIITTPSIPEAGGSSATLVFDFPATPLDAGVPYLLTVSRTGSGNYILPVWNSSTTGKMWSDFPGRFLGSSESYAVTEPVVGSVSGSSGNATWAIVPILSEG